MFCQRCGQQLKDGQVSCPLCGWESGFNNTFAVSQTDPNDKNNTGLNVLAFIIPLFGLIYYLCNRNDHPIEAKGVGKWGLIGFISWIVFYFLLVIVVFVIVFIISFSALEWSDGNTIALMLSIFNVR